MKIEITDRYEALGIPRPDPETMCEGQCEGIGWIPVYMNTENIKGSLSRDDEKDPQLITAWQEAEKIKPTDDGWHFVKCPDCNGTGKAPHEEA